MTGCTTNQQQILTRVNLLEKQNKQLTHDNAAAVLEIENCVLLNLAGGRGVNHLDDSVAGNDNVGGLVLIAVGVTS